MNLVYTGRFKKDFKRMMRRNKDEQKLQNIISILLEGQSLPARCEDHSLGGNGQTGVIVMLSQIGC